MNRSIMNKINPLSREALRAGWVITYFCRLYLLALISGAVGNHTRTQVTKTKNSGRSHATSKFAANKGINITDTR